MAMTDNDWRSEHTSALFGAILRLETPLEAERFFRDLCTLGELRDLAQRWAVVRMLDAGLHYAEISKRTGASTATITRIRGAGSPDSPAAGPGAAAGPERS
jgi:TrpR-related protein YerC/YecD